MISVFRNTFFVATVLMYACSSEKSSDSVAPENWESRVANVSVDSFVMKDTIYLPVYSHIYSKTEHRKHDLTITVSIRNTSLSDSIYVTGVDYYHTKGQLVSSFVKNPVYVGPMETIEIVLDKEDDTGGSGANFIIYWGARKFNVVPIFQAVMISTSGQQGIAFTSDGVSISKK